MSETKRLVIILPADKFDEFQELVDEQYETMSAVGRRLILEWLEEQKRNDLLFSKHGQ